jgi:hypothetical protein
MKILIANGHNIADKLVKQLARWVVSFLNH